MGLYKGLYDDYHVGDKPKSKEAGDGRIALPPDVIYSDAIYAKDIEQYYEYRCKSSFTHKVLSPLVPIELTLTTYGISGILPGDIFNIDYLPAQYRKRTYFQVMNVEHSVDSTGWKTTFQTQMRVNKSTSTYTLAFKRPEIYLSSKSELLSSKLDSTIRNFFKDFQLDDSTTNLVTVFRVKGRLKNKIYDARNTMNNEGNAADGKAGYQQWQKYSNYSVNKRKTPRPPKGDGTAFTGESGNYGRLEIKLDEPYTLLIGNGGAVAVVRENWNNADFKKLIYYFGIFVSNPMNKRNLETTWYQGPQTGTE